ncbi:insertion element IS1661 protein, partial [Yersinia pestis PY-66]
MRKRGDSTRGHA